MYRWGEGFRRRHAGARARSLPNVACVCVCGIWFIYNIHVRLARHVPCYAWATSPLPLTVGQNENDNLQQTPKLRNGQPSHGSTLAGRRRLQEGRLGAAAGPEMAREGDILQIVRTWTFTNDALETRSLRGDR